MKYSKIVEKCYFDLQDQMKLINKTWQIKIQKLRRKNMPEIRIAWYYDYAIQRGKYRVYLKYRSDIFNSLQMEIDRKTLRYLGGIFNSFSNIKSIPINSFNNEV